MADMDPVAWDDVEAATGPPSATGVMEYVEAFGGEIADDEFGSAYEAVKTVYDEWKTDQGEARSLPDQGAAFVVAYRLEHEGLLDLSDSPQGSLVERHPGRDELHERFWDEEQTLWWMAVELGVHFSLVTFWLWEADIPLAERNLSDETMRQVEAHREDEER
jgi:hypothetical protein